MLCSYSLSMRRSHRRGQYGGFQHQPIREPGNASDPHRHTAATSIDSPSGALSPELRAAFLRVVTEEDRLFLSRYLTFLGFTGADHADLVQEVLSVAVETFPRFDPSQGGVRPWLVVIADRQASNLRRRAYRRRDVELTHTILDGLTDPAPVAEQVVMQASREGVLWELLQRIPKARLEVFVARELVGLSFAEIAERQEITEALAKTRYRLAWRDIRRFRSQWQAQQRFRGHPTTAIVVAWLVNSGALRVVEHGAGRWLGGILLVVILAVVGMLASVAPSSTEAVAVGRAGTTAAAVTGPGPAAGAAVSVAPVGRDLPPPGRS